MHWQDDVLILGARPFGETSAIAEALSRTRGRWRGLVRGGRSRRMRPLLQTGNLARATWRARLEDQLGAFTLEPLRMSAGGLIGDPFALAGLGALAGHLHLLPEREPFAALYDGALLVVENLHEARLWPALLARLELRLLADLGFGLDVDRCALTGAREDLAFVSPRTGRAVRADAAGEWKDRLLPLPPFLTGQGSDAPGEADVLAALELTGHFLHQRVYAPRGLAMPEARRWIIDHLRGA